MAQLTHGFNYGGHRTAPPASLVRSSSYPWIQVASLRLHWPVLRIWYASISSPIFSCIPTSWQPIPLPWPAKCFALRLQEPQLVLWLTSLYELTVRIAVQPFSAIYLTVVWASTRRRTLRSMIFSRFSYLNIRPRQCRFRCENLRRWSSCRLLS